MVMHELKNLLLCELEELTEKDQVTTDSLEAIAKIVDTIKDIDEIDAEDGYSREGRSMKRGYSREGRGYSDRYPYGYSYRTQKRDSMGRYSRDYSGDHVVEKLERAMDEAPSEERESIRQAINNMMHKFQ